MNDFMKRGLLAHAEALGKGEYSSEELTRSYLEEIDRRDGDIGAYISVCRDKAISAARESDKRRSEGRLLSRFDGVPIAVKDNISTAGTRTTCASRMLEKYIPPYDATVIERLKLSGFVMLGKTNMDEFGMGSSTENSAFGVTANPIDQTRVPGGSSGGSAAAVAAGFAPCALGSDTGGSVRQPSAFCGTVGMRPTYGRVSRYGLVAFASSLDQIGPISSNVADNAALLGVISGKDKRDATTLTTVTNYEENIQNGALGLRIGLPKELFSEGVSDEVKDTVIKAARVYESMGARVVEISIPSVEYALSAYYLISGAEASSNLARFDGVRYGRRASEYADIDELYVRSRSEGFGAEVKRRIMLGTFALSAGYCDKYYGRAKKTAELLRYEIDAAFDRCDLLLSPTAPEVAFRIGDKIKSPTRMYAGDICSVPAALAGIPALSIPCGKSEGLPVGMQLMGRALSEPLIYRAAYAYEREKGGGDE